MPDVGNCVGDTSLHFATSKHVSTVGSRQVFEGARLVNEHKFYNKHDGVGDRDRRIYLFDHAGDCLVWMTAASTASASELKGDKRKGGRVPADEGVVCDLHATVIRHDEFRGVKQTAINRVSVLSIDGREIKKMPKSTESPKKKRKRVDGVEGGEGEDLGGGEGNNERERSWITPSGMNLGYVDDGGSGDGGGLGWSNSPGVEAGADDRDFQRSVESRLLSATSTTTTTASEEGGNNLLARLAMERVARKHGVRVESAEKVDEKQRNDERNKKGSATDPIEI